MPDRLKQDRLIIVGVLAGAHGVRGDVRVKSFTDNPEDLFSLGPLLSEKGDPLLEAAGVKSGSGHFIVTAKRARQKEEWDALKGTKLCVPRHRLPPPDDDEFYVEDLVALNVMDSHGKTVGTVKSVQNFGAGDLIEVAPDTGAAWFVPFTLKEVPEVHFEGGYVIVRDPETWADQSDPRKKDDTN
ncbi:MULTISPECIES: ribosome maturation factor RimM [Henriciella]|jgi:16S rRNA processing protein RimM|uniref:Ribosome maturation factor RimM n=1 Tax=Henriciella pelagia TaxID=1977912 RepID=A0ABQ1JNQ2_9PROT|nr:ribosome maturation factor RimM [Henriciella pelagia]GGB70833.1 ribosome maturation factor RimM [Henriciella pelagia]